MNITPLPHACQSSAVSANINTLPFMAAYQLLAYQLLATRSNYSPTQKNFLFKCILCYFFLCYRVCLVGYFNFVDFKILCVVRALFEQKSFSSRNLIPNIFTCTHQEIIENMLLVFVTTAPSHENHCGINPLM